MINNSPEQFAKCLNDIRNGLLELLDKIKTEYSDMDDFNQAWERVMFSTLRATLSTIQNPIELIEVSCRYASILSTNAFALASTLHYNNESQKIVDEALDELIENSKSSTNKNDLN